MDPTTGKGTIEHQGLLVFSSARKRLPFKDLTVKTKRTPLIARVGGGQLKVASAGRISYNRDGFGTDFTATRLMLSAKVAERLNKKLRPKIPFKEGQPIGQILTRMQPLTIAILERGRATLLFAPSFVAKLESLHVSLNPIFPAEHQGATFTFPIIPGGALAPNASLGTLRTGGEVEFLQLGGGQIFWHEPWAELGSMLDSAEANVEPSPPYPGKQGRIGLLRIAMATASVSSNPQARTIAVQGASLLLEAAAASAFNEAFANKEEVFKAGEALGTLSFTAQGQ